MKTRNKGIHHIAILVRGIIITTSVLIGGIFNKGVAACDYYASPTGTGNGLSQSTPFKTSNFWSVAQPGKTLCLLDGQYTGSSSVINPPQGLSGTAGLPITVKALNDGKVTINGQGSLLPVDLSGNRYFVLEGFNAHNSSESVIYIHNNSSNIIVKRVCGWDARDGNYDIFSVAYSSNVLLEDCAAWGTARKVYQPYSSSFVTFRRCWGRWERSTIVGPKTTFEMQYYDSDMIFENCIATWNSTMGSGVDQPYGVFATTGAVNNPNVNIKLLGSIAYIRASDSFQPDQVVQVLNVDSFEIRDSVVYIEPGSYGSKRTWAGSANNDKLIDATGGGGAGSAIPSQWQVSNHAQGSTLGSIYGSGQGVFYSSPKKGATVCKRYVNGALTSDPLWPWPMNQRIIDALIVSGRQAVDVTASIEQMFGLIPQECKNGTQPENSPPSNLRIISGS